MFLCSEESHGGSKSDGAGTTSDTLLVNGCGHQGVPHLPGGRMLTPAPPLLKGLLTPWRSLLFFATTSSVLLAQRSPVFLSLSGSGRGGQASVCPSAHPTEPSRAQTDRCDALRDVCHIEEVVLLSRPFWMLMQQLTTAVQFCVICWMTLHVNCRPN